MSKVQKILSLVTFFRVLLFYFVRTSGVLSVGQTPGLFTPHAIVPRQQYCSIVDPFLVSVMTSTKPHSSDLKKSQKNSSAAGSTIKRKCCIQMAPSGVHASKRVKLEAKTPEKNDRNKLPLGFSACQALLATSRASPMPSMPSTLTCIKTKNDLGKMRTLFDKHGFRTSVVHSPRAALSIYLDSCNLSSSDEPCKAGKEFLLTMLGMHPSQNDIECWYAVSMKKVYCLMLFCNLCRELCPQAVQNDAVSTLLTENETLFSSLCVVRTIVFDDAHKVCTTVSERVAGIVKAIVDADSKIRPEQLQHEFDRITFRNSTMANVVVQLFLDTHSCCIKDVYFKSSHLENFQRITLHFYNPEVDELRPPSFTFLPSLHRALESGPEGLVQDMIRSFWGHLLRHGYFATPAIKSEFTPDLEKYFLSGITQNENVPLLLNAHFTPCYALSFYLHGKAGSGKSSFVRNFSPALNATIEEHTDPEILVRFVKQNLNKPFQDLRMEFELRPNNNDLSVMSIIQGRRMTIAQSKPGLVVVNLEEMASNEPGANPNQLKTAQLISQRFAGRTGEYKHSANASRNLGNRGISGDASLVALFTSNYELDEPCRDALLRLQMFSNLKCIHATAVSGEDRQGFARVYIQQCVQDRFAEMAPECHVELQIPVGVGDTRPLVRQLRMLSFYLCGLVADSVTVGGRIAARITKSDKGTYVIASGEHIIALKTSSLQNLLPMVPRVFDERARKTVEGMCAIYNGSTAAVTDSPEEILQIVDFFFAKILAPAVVVSNDANLIKNLVALVGAQEDVQAIKGVNPKSYKIMKSLYDSSDTPNLRDDILKFGRGALVAVELQCQSKDAQLCIREMIEDSPSQTAFSTIKSALYKDGLFFGVYVEGEITPEVRSRASLII